MSSYESQRISACTHGCVRVSVCVWTHSCTHTFQANFNLPDNKYFITNPIYFHGLRESVFVCASVCIWAKHRPYSRHCRSLHTSGRDEKYLRSREQDFFSRCNAMLHQTKPISVSVPILMHPSWLWIVVVWFLDPDIAFLGNFAEVLPVAIHHNYGRKHNHLSARSQLDSIAFSLFTTTCSPGVRRYWERSPSPDH